MSTSAPEDSKARGCAKPLAIVAAGFFVMMGLVVACGPDTTEAGIETTVTVTESASTVVKTTTKTVTTTAEPSEEVTTEAAEEPPLELEDAPEPVADTVIRGFVSAPDPAPAPAPAPAPTPVPALAPAPAPAPVGRTVTGGAFCKNVEVGQTGQTTTGLTLTCSKAVGDDRARWR